MDTMGEHDLAKANYDLLLDVYLLAPKSWNYELDLGARKG
jgi:hypothetical protein